MRKALRCSQLVAFPFPEGVPPLIYVCFPHGPGPCSSQRLVICGHLWLSRYRIRIGPFRRPRSACAANLVYRNQVQICNVAAVLEADDIIALTVRGRPAEVPNASGAIACKMWPPTGPASGSSGDRRAANQRVDGGILECFDVITEVHPFQDDKLPACQCASAPARRNRSP